jgi:hypothetical protein
MTELGEHGKGIWKLSRAYDQLKHGLGWSG